MNASELVLVVAHTRDRIVLTDTCQVRTLIRPLRRESAQGYD